MNSNFVSNNSVVVELSNLVGLVLGTTGDDALGYYLAVYSIANALMALVVWWMLPHKYRYPAYLSYTYLFSIALFIPFLGAIGLLICVWPGLSFPYRQKDQVLDIQEKIQLPYAQLKQNNSPLFNDGGLQDVLSLQTDDNKRLNALLAVRNMHKQDAIPILKKALRDPADDIRLLAYAMLDKYETQLNAKLEQVLEAIKNAEDAHKAELHNSIARNYWELVYLGLAQGAVLKHALQQAQDNIEQALLFKETPELMLLAGRVALKQGRSEFATLNFNQAIALGMEAQHVLPYLAEAAYLSGHYHQIPELLSQLPRNIRNRYPFVELVDYWHAN